MTMFGMRLWLLSAFACARVVFAQAPAPGTGTSPPVGPPVFNVLGIRFGIGDGADTGPMPAAGLLTQIAGAVEVAAGRGRIDVYRKEANPVVRVDSVEIAPPLADSGDYYLFDSAGFALVRPRSKTFSSFSFSASSYNYKNSREGFPGCFSLAPVHVDTVVVTGRSQHVELRTVPIYWHMEYYRDRQHHDPIQIIAAGRMTVDSAPPGEFTVFRWFGPKPSGAKSARARCNGCSPGGHRFQPRD